MTQGTIITLKGARFNNEALLQYLNFRELIANSAACVGAWKFDDDALVEEDSTGVNRVLNWKSGGTPLAYASGTKASRVVSEELGSRVLSLPSAAVYRATGLTWNSNSPFSLLMVVKPTNYDTEQQVLGATRSSTAAQNACLQVLKNGSVPSARLVRNASLPISPVPDPSRFVSYIGAYGGASDPFLSAQYLGGPVARSATSDAGASGLALDLGNPARAFAGQVDFVALFNVDILNQQPDLKNYLDNYLRYRLRKS